MDKCIKPAFISAFLFMLLFFSCSRHQEIPEFDEIKAYRYLEEQCEFGARTPNSEAHDLCEDYLFNMLSATTPVCKRQKFIYYDVERDDTLYLTNLIASYNPRNEERILLCAHWDCRPWADEDPDSSRHNEPVMGANDGASGTAVLLAIAEIFKIHPPPLGVDLIFFDGEDYGQRGTMDQWCLGSKHFARNIGNYRPAYVILLDLVGDADLNIHKEYYSQLNAGWLVTRIWNAAAVVQAEHFYPDVKHNVYDDHIPFMQIGIPAVNIIDMDYQYWHTVVDTPDKCSPESLGEVGRVVIRTIYDRSLRE
jgi:glutaminyl-peptide cyclotransferase